MYLTPFFDKEMKTSILSMITTAFGLNSLFSSYGRCPSQLSMGLTVWKEVVVSKPHSWKI